MLTQARAIAGGGSGRGHVLDVSSHLHCVSGSGPIVGFRPSGSAQSLANVHAVSRRYGESFPALLLVSVPDVAVVAPAILVYRQVVGREPRGSSPVDRSVGEAHHHAGPGRVRFATLYGRLSASHVIPCCLGEGSRDETARHDDARIPHRRLCARESRRTLCRCSFARL